MIFRQITHDDLGCASYLVGDDDAGLAAVVDPRLDIDEYLRLALYLGTRIEHVLETHNHADHVSGHGRLAASTGATIHIHRAATPEYDHVPFDDGWKLVLGRLVVRALHTPGHRPEHTAFALVDTDRGPGPWAVLTGDSLFVGGIARPDLAVDPREGAHGIFHSLHGRLLTLPDTCEVWPGHLSGSTRCPTASTPTSRWRSSARRASALRSAPACWPATARARSSTSSTAAWARGRARAGHCRRAADEPE